jgi:hypothetical protein
MRSKTIDLDAIVASLGHKLEHAGENGHGSFSNGPNAKAQLPNDNLEGVPETRTGASFPKLSRRYLLSSDDKLGIHRPHGTVRGIDTGRTVLPQ